MAETKIAEHIFRQYDIRGLVGDEINNELAYLLGRAYARIAEASGKNNIAIGYDCRESSPGLAAELCRGINDEGLDATLLGMGPTPVVYWSLFEFNFGGGIQVTGSHNPSNMNGFKICLGQDSLFGDKIQELKKLIFEINENPECNKTAGKTEEKNILDNYIKCLVDNSKPHQGSRKLKIVVDAGNGVGGMVGAKALRQLGHEVIELYCDPDGTFPNHHPDPTVPKNLVDLQARVKSESADMGIGWDGDGDRIGLVDENAEIIYGDMLLLIYAREVLKGNPGAAIIADVKCSSLLFNKIDEAGGKGVMWMTGHSLIKSKLKELEALLAGEMSGHIFFKHRFYGFDCASYCSCRLAEIISSSDQPVSSYLSDLPETFNTPEIRIDCPEEQKFEIIKAAKEAFKDFKTNNIDGVRVEFPEGWGLLRASNTQPVLVSRFEANSEEKLAEYQKIMMDKLENIQQSL